METSEITSTLMAIRIEIDKLRWRLFDLEMKLRFEEPKKKEEPLTSAKS